jgi:outer membrane lipoprotein-sorting protein
MKQFALAPMLAPVLAALIVLSASAGWAAEKLPLSAISDYLNGLKTAQGPFTQINNDGSLSTGTLYMHRPGRMRFEYDPPNSAVVIAGGGALTIHDPKSNQPPESFPLRRTPLSIILAKKVDLERADMVVGYEFDGTATVVTAQDPENPEYGSIDLMFTADPVELRKWVIHDGSGGQTTVIMGGLQTGGRLSGLLFTTQIGAGSVNR